MHHDFIILSYPIASFLVLSYSIYSTNMLRSIGIAGRPMRHKCPTNTTKCGSIKQSNNLSSPFRYALIFLMLPFSFFLTFSLHFSFLLSSPYPNHMIDIIIRWVNHYNSIVASYKPGDVPSLFLPRLILPLFLPYSLSPFIPTT